MLLQAIALTVLTVLIVPIALTLHTRQAPAIMDLIVLTALTVRIALTIM